MSAKNYARLCGVLYLFVTIFGVFAVYGPKGITAQMLIFPQNQLVWRLAIASNIVAGMLYVAVTMILYRLTKPVSATVSVMAAMFSIAGITIGISAEVFRLLAAALDPRTQGEMVAAFMRGFNQGENICLIFFGVYCFLLGVLIYRSTYLPKLIGAFMMLGGVCYWVDSFSTIIAPVATASWPPFSIVSGLAELSLTLWLIVIGVNAERWHASAGGDAI